MTTFCKEQIGIDPEVLGYQVLIKAPSIQEKTSGGIIRPDSLISEQQRRHNIGLILKIGPSAFKDKCEDRRCEVGDWVAYSNFERSVEYVGAHILYYVSDAHILSRYSDDDVKKILEKIK